jgi:hydrogenase small subunit
MANADRWFLEELNRRGVSRREFLAFCGVMSSALALPTRVGAQIAKAVAATDKPPVIWLEFHHCAGDTESLLRAIRPTVAELVLDTLSLDYHETIMAAAGHQAEAARAATMEKYKGKYIAVVEGSIPTAANGIYCTVGGRTALDIARHVCGDAAATIAIGTCATYGGLPAAAPNPTGALGVADAVPAAKNVINLPACPANVENLTATIVYFLTFKRWPPMDRYGRPLFAYGKLIHDNCERRAHYDAGQYVEAWGDVGHRKGYCLYKMGSKGPACFHNCPSVGWNGNTSWPIACGHPCIGCAEPNFWDRMTPFYTHLAGVPGFGVQSHVDNVGALAVAGVGAAFATHGLIQIGKRMRSAEPPVGPEEKPS